MNALPLAVAALLVSTASAAFTVITSGKLGTHLRKHQTSPPAEAPMNEPADIAEAPAADPGPQAMTEPAAAEITELAAELTQPPAEEAPAETTDPLAGQGAAAGAMLPPVLGDSVPRAARYPWRLPGEPGPPAVAADEAVLGDLTVRAASVVGAHHRCAEPAAPRQDAYRIGRDKAGQHLIVAVADGVSSGSRSEVGAAVAAEATVRALRRRMDDGCELTAISAAGVFTEVSVLVRARADRSGLSPRDVSTTLLAAVIPATSDHADDGRRTAWVATVADTTAWMRTGEAWTRLAGDSKEGLDANTVSACLPADPDLAEEILVDIVHGATIAFVTDGVGDALADLPGADHWFARRWATPPPVASFIVDVNFESRAFVDDRTAVVVWCRASEPGGA